MSQRNETNNQVTTFQKIFQYKTVQDNMCYNLDIYDDPIIGVTLLPVISETRQMIAHAQMSLPNFRRTLFTTSHTNCQSITTAENVVPKGK